MTTPVPQQAINDAARILHESVCDGSCSLKPGRTGMPVSTCDGYPSDAEIDTATDMLEAAAEAIRADERGRLGIPPPGERDLVLADLGKLLDALGLGDHARPLSPHEVILEAIAEVARLRGTEGKWWAGPGDHPVRAPCDCECSVAATTAERERIRQGLESIAARYRDAGVSGMLGEVRDLLRETP